MSSFIEINPQKELDMEYKYQVKINEYNRNIFFPNAAIVDVDASNELRPNGKYQCIVTFETDIIPDVTLKRVR